MTFSQSVSAYMSTDLAVVTPDTSLARVAALFEHRGISAVPVLVEDGQELRVITRSDLLHAGRVTAGDRPNEMVVVLPALRVATVAGHAPLTCAPSTTLREAARQMLAGRVHRLFVVDDGRPVGVISTHDLASAVNDARVATPLIEMCGPRPDTLPAGASLHRARLALERSLHGVVVELDHWPIGVFTPLDALASRDLPPSTLVDHVCDHAVLTLPARLPLHHAAAMAATLDPCRVIAMDGDAVAGMASGLDLARVVAA